MNPALRLSTIAIAITLTLLTVSAAWQLSRAHWVLAALCVLPAGLALRGLMRYRPGTRAWTTLCAIPYVLLGLVELIANPAARGWAAACVLLAFAQFATLALLLRVAPVRS